MKTSNWIAIDWGTSNFRAFLLNEEGQIQERIALPHGLLAVKDGNFAPWLASTLHPWLSQTPDLPILMAGMVGSRKGWTDVPYCTMPANDTMLARQAQEVIVGVPHTGKAWIIPGVNGRNSNEEPDVMRGEEVQLLGLHAQMKQEKNEDEVFAILPGTHSKHARIKQGQIESFTTYMTGELYACMWQYSILGRGLIAQQSSETAFLEGVRCGHSGQVLSSTLFSTRTRYLAGDLAESEVSEFLSGLLIGAELQGLKQAPNQHYYIVGGDTLSTRYLHAMQTLGLKASIAEGDACFLAGMRRIVQLMNTD